MDKPLKVLHFSDIHIGTAVRDMALRWWLSKRSIGAINLLRGRAKHFNDAKEKMQALVRFKEENSIDLVINTGDYTALGLESELQLAKSFVAPLMTPPQRYVTVPGNHDIYVHKSNSHDRFTKEFYTVLHTDLPEYSRGGGYPLVRFVGEDVALIALNSSRPNPSPWRSNGLIPQEQLDALDEILSDDRVKNRFIFVITHYAPRLKNGKDDTKLHGLINANEFLDRCKSIQSGAILCGHIHETYRVSTENLKSDIYCAGSATMKGREGFWVYEIESRKLQARRVHWDRGAYHFVD